MNRRREAWSMSWKMTLFSVRFSMTCQCFIGQTASQAMSTNTKICSRRVKLTLKQLGNINLVYVMQYICTLPPMPPSRLSIHPTYSSQIRKWSYTDKCHTSGFTNAETDRYKKCVETKCNQKCHTSKPINKISVSHTNDIYLKAKSILLFFKKKTVIACQS